MGSPTGKMFCTRAFVIGSLVCLLPLAGYALELQTVLDRTMITAPSRVEFREVRHNKLLKSELVISGYLEYLQGGSMRKVIEDPFHEAYLIDGDTIEIDRDGTVETLSLKKSRSLKTMLGGIGAILAGETEQIEKVFHSEINGADDNWTLELRPRSRRIGKQLHLLTVTGNAESILSIRFDLKGGEWHEMEIQANDRAP